MRIEAGLWAAGPPGVIADLSPGTCGVTSPGQPGGAKVGNLHQIPARLNEKWVGILWYRQAKGPAPPDLAPCSCAALCSAKVSIGTLCTAQNLTDSDREGLISFTSRLL